MLGLLVATFALGSEAWAISARVLDLFTQERRDGALLALCTYLRKVHNADVSEWCCKYWQHMGEQQFSLLQALRVKSTTVDYSVLLASLVV